MTDSNTTLTTPIPTPEELFYKWKSARLRRHGLMIGLCGYAGSGKDASADLIEAGVTNTQGYEGKVTSLAFANGVRDVAWALNSYFPVLTTQNQEPGLRKSSWRNLLETEARHLTQRLETWQEIMHWQEFNHGAGGKLIGYDPDNPNEGLPFSSLPKGHPLMLAYEVCKWKYLEVRPHLVAIGHCLRSQTVPDIWIQTLAVRAVPLKNDGNWVCIKDVRYVNEVEIILSQGGIVFYLQRTSVGPANKTEEESIRHILDKFDDKTYASRFIRLDNSGDLAHLEHQIVHHLYHPGC